MSSSALPARLRLALRDPARTLWDLYSTYGLAMKTPARTISPTSRVVEALCTESAAHSASIPL